MKQKIEKLIDQYCTRYGICLYPAQKAELLKSATTLMKQMQTDFIETVGARESG